VERITGGVIIMTDKVFCPWCGREMEHTHIEPFDGCHGAWFNCGRCGAVSPTAYSLETKENAIEAARTAALRRYEPPIRPLTREEVKPGVLKIDEWVEFSNGYVRHIIPDVIDGEYLWDKNDCYYDLRTYGTDWRLWPRRPTEQERQAYGWEDAE
jgi:hypothetical protein